MSDEAQQILKVIGAVHADISAIIWQLVFEIDLSLCPMPL